MIYFLKVNFRKHIVEYINNINPRKLIIENIIVKIDKYFQDTKLENTVTLCKDNIKNEIIVI